MFYLLRTEYDSLTRSDLIKFLSSQKAGGKGFFEDFVEMWRKEDIAIKELAVKASLVRCAYKDAIGMHRMAKLVDASSETVVIESTYSNEHSQVDRTKVFAVWSRLKDIHLPADAESVWID